MDIGRLFSHAWGLFVKDIGPLIIGALIAGIVPAVAATVVLVATLGATFATSSVSAEGEIESLSSAGVALLVIGLTLVVVVAVLLSAPLYAGLAMGIVRRVRENRTMGYGDTFQGFAVFAPVVGVSALVAAIVVVLFVVPFVLAVLAIAVSSWLLGAAAVGAGLAAVVVAVYLYVRWAYIMLFIVDQGATATGALRASAAAVAAVGWWNTFVALIVVTLVVSVVGGVLGVIPFVGAVASLLLTPFALTYLVAMYLAARHEDGLIDAALRIATVTPGWPGEAPGAGEEPLPPPAGGSQGYGPAPAPPQAGTDVTPPSSS